MIIDLNLKGKKVVVFGAGREAARKVDGLLTQNCTIIVIADDIHKDIKNWKRLGKIEIKKTRVRDGGLLMGIKDLILVIAATNDPGLNRSILNTAKSRRCYAYAVDDPDYSDFSHPAIINLEDTVLITVSTMGRSPLVSRLLRERLEPILNQIIKTEDIMLVKLQDKLKGLIKFRLSKPDERRSFLLKISNDPIITNLLSKKKISEAEEYSLKLLDGFVNV